MKKIPMKKIVKLLALVAVVFVIGGVGGVFFEQSVLPMIRTSQMLSNVEFFRRVSDNVTVINRTEQVMVRETDSINELVSQPSTAVVQITSVQKNPKTVEAKEQTRIGSGFIIASDGLIATYRTALFETNAQYSVVLRDGSRLQAQLFGIDEATNIAYLKVDAGNLPVVSFANSDEYGAGKKLIAIASSEVAYQNTYASGLLSAVQPTFNISGKALSSTEKVDGVFKTDFIHTPEFLGAPVVAYSGNVVGMTGSVMVDNTATYFEIPSNMIKKSVDRAMRSGLSESPVFGAYYVSLTPAYAAAHGISQDHGALIYSPSGKQGLAVLVGSVAERGGIRINDIVTAINDQELSVTNSLANVLTQYKKGETLKLTIIRGEETITVDVTL